jgi:very-short-patch-repair endonuclease
MNIVEALNISPIIYWLLVIVVVVTAFGIWKTTLNRVSAPKFSYIKKKYLITRAEHEFYNALVAGVGNDFYIFAQVHLPTLIDHKIKGQNWQGAFSHINRKSVDFVLCDKSYISPVLAIELDDKSHLSEDRRERDGEIERILSEAGMPLLRVENHGKFDPNIIASSIRQKLSST